MQLINCKRVLKNKSGRVFVFAISRTIFLLVFGMSAIHAADQIKPTERDTRFFDSPPSVEEIGSHLFPESAPERRTRSITFSNATDKVQTEKSVGLPILFHFGKTTIVKQSQPYLDSIGQMMISPEFESRTLVVEGHTDAIGSNIYNQRLSELRALSVKEYLIRQFNINPLRLFPMGRGESVLREPNEPHNPVNRRVEFLPFKSS